MKIFILSFFIALFILPLSAQHPIFFGTTYVGGIGLGSIYTFDPGTGRDSVAADFFGGYDGYKPWGGLAYDPSNGLLYGMANGGSLGDSGIIYKMSPQNGNYELDVAFFTGESNGQSNGAYPYGNLLYDTSTNRFYGMTSLGGSADKGILFYMNDTTFHTAGYFNGTGNGAIPYGSLVYGPTPGVLYGMTDSGGAYGGGTIFSIDHAADDSIVNLWNFGSGTDAAYPHFDLVYVQSEGLFYGTTSGGGLYRYGTIFSFDPVSDTEKVLWSFDSAYLGRNPTGDMIYDPAHGVFYGVTAAGGIADSTGYGTLFSFDPSSDSVEVLWRFGSDSDGRYPYSGLVFDSLNGMYYGTTIAGGKYDSTSGGGGTIYSLDPATDSVRLVWNFGGRFDGMRPYGSLMLYTPARVCSGIGTWITPLPDSMATITAQGSTPPYTYVWSTTPVQYGDTATSLVPGDTYTVTVTDSNGCSAVSSFTDTLVCPVITLRVRQLDSSSAYIVVTGGTPPYTYVWSSLYTPDQYTDTIQVLHGVDYSIQATDATGCSTEYGSFGIGLGISSVSNTQMLTIYPSPTTGIVSLSGLTAGQTIEVYDYIGQKVSSTTTDNTTAQINLTSHQSGVYMVTVLNSDGSIASQKKVVKEN